MATATKKRRLVPPRLLAALRHAGKPDEEIRRHYGIPAKEPLPDGPPEPLTVEDVELLPDDGYQYELWEGRLVRMSPTKRVHGATGGEIVGRLCIYLAQNPIGKVYIGETGFRAGPGETLYCPDAAYVSHERAASVGDNEFFPFAPDIAIEVWSPDNTERGMATKTAHYLAHGAKAVWILRPQDRTLRVHRPGGPVQSLSGDDLLSEDTLPGWAVRVGDLFTA